MEIRLFSTLQVISYTHATNVLMSINHILRNSTNSTPDGTEDTTPYVTCARAHFLTVLMLCILR